MRAATKTLLALAILATALSLFGRQDGASRSISMETADSTAVCDSLRKSGHKHTVEEKADDADNDTDSTFTEGEGWETTLRSFDPNSVINAPEQPEAVAFTPTMMNDIEAATPTAGLNFISPPTANNRGTATLDYPFIMPPARNGMQPRLGLSYDSDSGDGICGEGWGLPIPSISVDTRWGVPRYDTTKETETYLMDGRMLAMQVGDSLFLAHRRPGIGRNTADNIRRFHPRTGTDFSLVERIGTSPGTYYWRVTAPDGTVYTYGDGNATLKGSFTDASGYTREVTAEWLLSRIEEPHGDYVSYHYHTANDTAVGGLYSKAVYLDSVKAGNAEGQEHTVVSFCYCHRGNNAMKTCSARYGFLTSSHQLLNSVTVSFQGVPLRSYGLQYTDGRFGRPLLSRVTHYDDHGDVAAFQDFSYYDDVSGTSGMVSPQNNSMGINSGDDDLDVELILNRSERNPSLLGGSSTQSKSVSLYAGAGVWDGSRWKGNTAGASYEYSEDLTKGVVTLTDINGDGLPDKVFRKNDSLWYRPMLHSLSGGMNFGSPIKLAAPVGSFSTVKSHTNNIGVKEVVGMYDITFQRGYDSHSTKARTTEYMADVNGDGLPDLVSNGRVWFNHLDTSGETPVPTFTEGSNLSPNPLVYTTAPDHSAISTPSDEQLDSIANDSPMQDVVRVWEAPRDGTVRLYGGVSLNLPPSSYDEAEYEKADGVHVAIEKGGMTLWSKTILRDDHTTYQPENVSSITVLRGERIYFRLQCGLGRHSNGAFDRVTWSPTVQYTTGMFAPSPNGETMGIYSSMEGIVGSALEAACTDGATSIQLRGSMVKPATSDNVTFLAIASNDLVDSLGNPKPGFQTDTIFKKTYHCHEIVNLQVDTVVNNPLRLPYVRMMVTSPTNVKWNAIKWTPSVVCVDSLGVEHKTSLLPSFNAYSQTFQEPVPFIVNNQGATVSVIPSLAMPDSLNGKVSLTVKGSNRIWGRKEYLVTNGIISDPNDTLSFTAPDSGLAWLELYWPDTLGIHTPVICSASVWVNRTSVSSSCSAGFHARRSDLSMGLMHRGWGAFAYSTDSLRCVQPINESLLHAPEVQEGEPIRLEKIAFMPLAVKADSSGCISWLGANEDVFITGSQMGVARLGEQDVTWSNPLPSDYSPSTFGNVGEAWTGAPAPVLVSSSKGQTNQDELTLPVPVPSLTSNSSNATTKGEITFLDMNGDGYPDIVADGIIQYTNALGGMSGERADGIPRLEAHASSVGVGVGGSPVNAASTIVSVVSGGRASASGRLASQLGKISVSGSGNSNLDFCSFDYVDVNGDGLPDLLSDEDGALTARLNLGYSFSDSVGIGVGHIQKGVSNSSNMGVSVGDSLCFGGLLDGTDVNKASASFSAGVGLTSTISREEESLVDVNGDGLPDIVWANSSGGWTRLNRGDSFAAPILLAGTRGIWESTTHGESANAAFTVTVNVPVIHAKFSVNPGGALGKSLTKTRTAIRDIDGDGFPDLVTSDSEESLNVRFSSIRRTNKLKAVANSLGGTFTISYGRSAPTCDHPGGKWVMDTLEVDRGVHFPDYDIPVTRKAFSYSGGVHDRREREFLGFAKVVSTDLDTKDGDAPYRSVTDSFDVCSYYHRGMLLSTTLRDAGGNKFTETENEYYTYSVTPSSSNTLMHEFSSDSPSDCRPVAYTPLKLTQNRNYEGGSNAVMSQTGYIYNRQGCGEATSVFQSSTGILSEVNTGGFSNFDYRVNISYRSIQGSKYERRTISLPTNVEVVGEDGTLYRKTSAGYGTEKNAAKATSIIRRYGPSDTDTTIIRYTYDERYGYLKSMAQYSESGALCYSYTYIDDYLNTYPLRVTAPHNLKTHNDSINLRYGLATKVVDPNNSILRTIYDGLGRLVSMKSPNESDAYPSTIDMRYEPVAVMRSDGTGILKPARAVTTYHLRQPYETQQGGFTHDDSMRVVVFVDGFGTVIQTQRDAMVGSSTSAPQLATVVEGKAEWDGLGRAVTTFLPGKAHPDSLLSFQPTTTNGVPSSWTEYDVADRPCLVESADGDFVGYEYSVEDGLMRITTYNGLNHQTDTYADADGRTVMTVMYRDEEGTQPIETTYIYDPVGRLVSVVDAGGDSTHVVYDMLDRRTEVRHPASGTTKWEYDKLGNVLSEENEALRALGEKVRYTWNVDQLVTRTCCGDSVKFYYGTGSSEHNTIGRLRFRQDHSGGTEYHYDYLGNVEYEKRTVVVPCVGHATFETEWKYDAFGKLLRMAYPGGENVVYSYNSKGDLQRVYVGREDAGDNYASSIIYDLYGNQTRLTYGNGLEEKRTHNAYNHRLGYLRLYSGTSLVKQRAYTYDNVGNVKKVRDTRSPSLTYEFSYDPLDRLVYATQRYGSIVGGYFATDTLSMAYDDLWRVTRKSQRLAQEEMMFPGTLSTGYDLGYTYGNAPGKHFQLGRVTESHYRKEGGQAAGDSISNTHSFYYDPNGNLKSEFVARDRLGNSTTNNISRRKLLWDGLNRLRGISEDGYVSLYWYDADGNRTVKEHLGGEAVWVNGTKAGVKTDSMEYSIYPSPYLSITGNRWTKHYYIGSERIASRTGTLGDFSALHTSDNQSAGNGQVASVNYAAIRVAEEDSIASYYAQLGVPYEVQRNTRGSGVHLYLPTSLPDDNRSTSTASEYASSERDRDSLRNTPATLDGGQVYYYHRDPLGSTLSVSDSVGTLVQQVEYTPWGEVFVELRGDSTFTTPYLFNGKELDDETGLYYYGARYYDPKLCVWYSTDPMEMDYPWVSTYVYCINNPVKLFDWNGEDWYQDDDGTIQYSPIVYSQKDLKKGQVYLFKNHYYRKDGINYRKDGSILYKNETAAYNRMWSQANDHYRKKGEVGGREQGGFILSDGSFLVMPDYLNDSRTNKFEDYGYIIKGSIITKGIESFSILGQVHTHQDKSVSPEPTRYLVSSYGDLGVSILMGGKPIITIGHDGNLYALKGAKLNRKKNPVVVTPIELPYGYNTRSDLLNGKAKLYLLLKNN